MRDGTILLIWDRAGPYHVARLKAVQELYAGKVRLVELGCTDGLYAWEKESSCDEVRLSRKAVEERDFFGRMRAFMEIMQSEKIHSVAISGYSRPTYLGILLLCRVTGIPVVLFAESWYSRGCVFDFLKGSFLQALCRSVFVSGERAMSHFRECLRFPAERIFMGYSVVDNAHFRNRRDKPNGLKRTFICVARMVSEKNVGLLMEAFLCANLPAQQQLLIVGSGPLKSALERSACGRIQLLGWTRYADLPALYASADWFILPSLFEPWGLVVNEAMAAGLPVIASSHCGCVPDLVTPASGMIFDPQSKASLVDSLERAARTKREQWKQLSEGARRAVSHLSPRHWAQQLIRACDTGA